MWKKYKQSWKEQVNQEIGDRSVFQALLFYGYIFLGNLGILFVGFVALTFLAWLTAFLHVLPAEEAGEMAGVILLGWLYLMLFFYCTKRGNIFIARVGEKIEKSVIDTLHRLQVLPILSQRQLSKFTPDGEAVKSFISSAPFIPPRRHA